MNATQRTIVLIPARMASSRLPGKPLAMIGGLPMTVQVLRRGEEAKLGPVVVAAAESEIVRSVEKAGGRAILTDPSLPSGSDRIHAGLQAIDPDGEYEVVINLQGDLPAISPGAIVNCHRALLDSGADIATLASEIEDSEELENPNVVKAMARFETGQTVAIAEDFQRRLPAGWSGPQLHHVGLYAYRRTALEAFVSLPPSKRERERKLEQMRALDAGMTIAVGLVDTIPFGVDTPEDLERARALFSAA
ncbi:MAG: 3-deoxy-manno-octulosonate cytidylyltransferase [Pseudomonadota bacterium]